MELSTIAWIPEWVLMHPKQAQGCGEIPLWDKNCFYWINILTNHLGPWWGRDQMFDRETEGIAEPVFVNKQEPLSFWNRCRNCSLTKTQDEISCKADKKNAKQLFWKFGKSSSQLFPNCIASEQTELRHTPNKQRDVTPSRLLQREGRQK